MPRRSPACGTKAGFTLLELLSVLVVIVLLSLALVPVLARSAPTSKALQCQANLRRFTAAWTMYSADFSDRVANNFGASETLNVIQNGSLANWANNVMTWTATGSSVEISVTNVTWAANGILGKYLNGSVDVYHCPADTYLSSVQRASGWTRRLRSISMNATFGRFTAGSDSTLAGKNWALPQYAQYLKLTRVPKPAKTWLIVEEHPDSINDGYFINNPSATSWQDIPSSLHNGACSFSFVDGHTELKRWQSNISIYPVQLAYPATRAFDAAGRLDFAWYLSRCGWIDAANSLPQFGY